MHVMQVMQVMQQMQVIKKYLSCACQDSESSFKFCSIQLIKVEWVKHDYAGYTGGSHMIMQAIQEGKSRKELLHNFFY